MVIFPTNIIKDGGGNANLYLIRKLLEKTKFVSYCFIKMIAMLFNFQEGFSLISPRLQINIVRMPFHT